MAIYIFKESENIEVPGGSKIIQTLYTSFLARSARPTSCSFTGSESQGEAGRRGLFKPLLQYLLLFAAVSCDHLSLAFIKH